MNQLFDEHKKLEKLCDAAFSLIVSLEDGLLRNELVAYYEQLEKAKTAVFRSITL